MLGTSFFGNLLYNINQVSFRQAIVPILLQGRLNATMRTIVWGTLPLGALTGGFLGEAIGLRPSIFIGVVAGAVAFLWVLFAPIRPDRQWCMTKDIGDVQCVKQTSFVRVTCQTPAATRVTAEANTNGPVIAPRRPDAINAKSAATPNAPQTRK